MDIEETQFPPVIVEIPLALRSDLFPVWQSPEQAQQTIGNDSGRNGPVPPVDLWPRLTLLSTHPAGPTWPEWGLYQSEKGRQKFIMEWIVTPGIKTLWRASDRVAHNLRRRSA